MFPKDTLQRHLRQGTNDFSGPPVRNRRGAERWRAVSRRRSRKRSRLSDSRNVRRRTQRKNSFPQPSQDGEHIEKGPFIEKRIPAGKSDDFALIQQHETVPDTTERQPCFQAWHGLGEKMGQRLHDRRISENHGNREPPPPPSRSGSMRWSGNTVPTRPLRRLLRYRNSLPTSSAKAAMERSCLLYMELMDTGAKSRL